MKFSSHLRNVLQNHLVNPLQSSFYQHYYSLQRDYGMNKEPRQHHIVVSLTSFPARFSLVQFSIKSILHQTIKPDVILLNLSAEEVGSENDLPESVLTFKKRGLKICIVPYNLKPHNKYIYAMQNYPDSLIITVDDDCIYDRRMIEKLYKSFLKYPKVISAKRVHKITRDSAGNLLPYRNWHYEYQGETAPSFDLLATGVGGVLYPPRLLPPEIFDIEKIKELCLNADDIWLKFMEIKNNIPVVWVKTKRVHPVTIRNSQKTTLQKLNFHDNQNDTYIANLKNHYGIDLTRCTKDMAQATI
ncbi:hypothetical protein FACS1894130_06570 [Spirochaetia bacterium]|nr:hypothetical protein FACS1894130_06570 [Spirochaetia bacterium]